MAQANSKRCLVAVDAPGGPLLCELTLPAEATIAMALAEARSRLDDRALDPPVDWEGGAVGVWGLHCGRGTVPRDGDRIELYRALAADPRQRRRQRVRTGRGR
jgi:putative ubiquitin-RnfH superfamily antitoxin RatB of RatAB toxin-antitoxin module